jgi:tetratricopeptide (TPR) repeat protein
MNFWQVQPPREPQSESVCHNTRPKERPCPAMFDGADDPKPPDRAPARTDDSRLHSSESGHAQISVGNLGSGSATRNETAAFAPGDLLAQRFRIIRFIGRGGMGEVYEAEDLELKESVAVKTLLPEIARNSEALERFKKEIQLARKVSHPNVCRTFELVRHEVSASSAGGSRSAIFLTMELLHGETLADAIRRKGRFTATELLPLARQMADALAAAHRVGIVHRDFKPGNVMLVGTGSESTPRAVVSDFGLSQQVSAESDGGVRGLAGTPDYMAPEQVTGARVEAAADVFSFGAVLYEALTGRLPFPALTREEAAQKRLREAPVAPSRFVPELPPDWERVVLRCLARDPKDRYNDPREAVHELEKSGRRKLWIVVAVVGACLLTGSYFLWRFLHPATVPRVAVIGLRNMTGDAQLDWVSTEVADTLSTYLPAKPKLEVIPREDVVRTLDDFSIPANEDLARVNIAPFREALGASYLVVGSYHKDSEPAPDGIHISLRLQGPRGETLDSLEKTGSAASMHDISIEAADEFRRAMGQSKIPAQDENSIYPQDADARRLYFEALSKLRSFNAGEALDILNLAAARDPKNPLIHSAKADALSMLRRDKEAEPEAQMAADIAARDSSLPQEYALLFKGKAAEMSDQWESAEKFYGSLYEFDPQRLNYGLKLASVQTSGSKPAEALHTLDRLAKLPKPLGQDPRISIERSKAFSALSDYKGAIQSAENALTIATARKARLMQADAELELCWAFRNLGEVDEARNSCDDAEKTFSVFGDQVSAGVAANNIATWLGDRGKYSEAKQEYERVIAIHEKAGDQKDLAGALLNSAKMSIYLGKSDEAEQLLRKSIGVSEPIEDKYNQALARIQLADVFFGRGDLNNSQKEAQTASDLALEIGDRSTEAFATSALARAKSENGDLPGALKDYANVLTIRQELQEPSNVARAKTRIANVYERMGDEAAAERNYKEALALDEKSQQSGDAAQDKLSLAELNIERKHFTDVEIDVTATIKTFHEQGDPDSEEDALAVLIQLFVEENKLDQAAAHLEDLKRLDSKDQDVELDAALAEGMFLTASHQSQEALSLLKTAAGEAEKSGRRYTALELDLVVAQAQFESGDRISAEKELSGVRAAAQRYGFKALAEKATALAQGSLH